MLSSQESFAMALEATSSHDFEDMIDFAHSFNDVVAGEECNLQEEGTEPFTDVGATTSDGAITCHKLDVISGRGKSSLNHPGNQNLQCKWSISCSHPQSSQIMSTSSFPGLVNEFAEKEYQYNITSTEKRQIQLKIIQRIEKSGGRFLKPSCKYRGWELIPWDEKRQKVAHALQYRVRLLRKTDKEKEKKGGKPRAKKAKKKKNTRCKVPVKKRASPSCPAYGTPLSHRPIALPPVLSQTQKQQYPTDAVAKDPADTLLIQLSDPWQFDPVCGTDASSSAPATVFFEDSDCAFVPVSDDDSWTMTSESITI